MADINVERRGGGTKVLPWVIGLVLLAALLWALMSLFGGDDRDEVEVRETEPAATAPAS